MKPVSQHRANIVRAIYVANDLHSVIVDHVYNDKQIHRMHSAMLSTRAALIDAACASERTDCLLLALESLCGALRNRLSEVAK